MRLALAAALTVLAAPASAQVSPALDAIAHPRTADAVAAAVGAITDAVLDVRIDRVRDAVDPRARDGARTLGDLVARDDPDYRERLRERTRDTVRTASATAKAASDLAPELQVVAAEFARRIEAAIARAGRP